MNYFSTCSGIEAASVAWEEIPGWRPVGFSEIEPFPCAVLAHRFPSVRNYGDMTKFNEWKIDETIRLLVGGTPCQSFSVAGLRKGLDDPRGNLTLTFLAMVRRFRPVWIEWENVPGVLSDKTGAFGAFLGGLAELGYGWSYRVLDAQYFGLAQRRKRVFVVGHLGGWQAAAAVLFERESMRWDNPPSREPGKGLAGTLGARTCRSSGAQDAAADHLIASAVTSKWAKGTGGPAGDECQNLVTHTLSGEGADASEDGTGRGTPIVPVAFDCKSSHQTVGEIAGTLRSMNHDKSHANGGGHLAVAERRGVRRITPREAERLQGFPDDWTLIPKNGRKRRGDDLAETIEYLMASGCSKDEAITLSRTEDGPRYKAIGNSMAVPVQRWIGRRIAMVDEILYGKH